MDEEIFMATYTRLHGLGIGGNYGGYYQTAYAVTLVFKEPDRLLLVTKWLYPEIAKHFGTTWQCVERNIRTVVNLAWRRNRTQLEALAGYPLEKKPSVGQFIAILAYHLNQDRAA